MRILTDSAATRINLSDKISASVASEKLDKECRACHQLLSFSFVPLLG